MKKKSNEQPLKEAIDAYLKAFKLEDKLRETNIVASWEKLVGPTIARYTDQIYIRDKVLFVHLRSAALRQELSMGKEKILSMLNTGEGQPFLTDVVFR